MSCGCDICLLSERLSVAAGGSCHVARATWQPRGSHLLCLLRAHQTRSRHLTSPWKPSLLCRHAPSHATVRSPRSLDPVTAAQLPAHLLPAILAFLPDHALGQVACVSRALRSSVQHVLDHDPERHRAIRVAARHHATECVIRGTDPPPQHNTDGCNERASLMAEDSLPVEALPAAARTLAQVREERDALMRAVQSLEERITALQARGRRAGRQAGGETTGPRGKTAADDNSERGASTGGGP